MKPKKRPINKKAPVGGIIIITGVAGMIFGATYLLAGRNLWPLILAHGLYDAIRMISFYFGYIG